MHGPFKYFTAAATIFALARALVAPTQTPPFDHEGLAPCRRIVKLKDGVPKSGLLSQIQRNNGNITHNWSIINAIAGEFHPHTLDALHAHPDVEFISEDGIVRVLGVQTNAPWGLSRISSTTWNGLAVSSALDYTYIYPDDKAGAGVDIYVVDSGIRTTHVTFEGRAHWGATFGGYSNNDDYGHGTHVAGIAVGAQYGVAKKANIIAVKVLSDLGSGTVSDMMSGLGWVKDQATTSGRPSVVSLSIGGPTNQALDSVIANLTSSGIHVVVAAGNSNVDAEDMSPAHCPSAVTVGAANITDARAYFSNYGSAVKIFAPGQDIISSWNTDDTATREMSGTSMAAPHISGLIAYFIARDGNTTPSLMMDKIQGAAQKGVLANIPSGTLNYLAKNL